jgi:RNA recognition motif-containing protein
MGKKLYVGNLPYSATNESLSAEFQKYGTVESVKIITDRETGRSKGFCFIEMSQDSEAAKAIQNLNGTQFGERAITVNEAKPQEPRSNQGGGNGGGRNRW